jgi:hypothetical protein
MKSDMADAMEYMMKVSSLGTIWSDGTTATEIALQREAAHKRIADAMRKKQAELEAKYRAELYERVKEMSCPIHIEIGDIYKTINMLLSNFGMAASCVSVTLPRTTFVALAGPSQSRMRFCDMEFLTGEDDFVVWVNPEFPADVEAVKVEVLRCLTGGRISKLPERPGGHSMGPGTNAVGEVGIASGAAIGNDGNAHRGTHLTHEAKVIAAKAALAAYARDKQLPSAEQLAAFRELDSVRAAKKGTVIRQTLHFDDVESNRDRLASEALGRAADQAVIAERGGAHRDFIGAAAQGFAEMLDAGDAPAHRKRAHHHRR